jgi:hypothetical protein
MPSTTKIVLGLILFWPLGLFWLLRRFHFRTGVAIALPAVLLVVFIAGVAAVASSSGGSNNDETRAAETSNRTLAAHSCGRIISSRVRETFIVITTDSSCARARSNAGSFFTPASDGAGWVAVGYCLSGTFYPGNNSVKACPHPTSAERRGHRLVLARIARVARERARLARERAKARARAHAAYVAAANAWHSGYDLSDPSQALYYRWRHDLSCAAYSTYCWRIEVITRDGCSSLFVEANEEDSGGTIIGDLIDSRDNIPPKTPVLLEMDSTSGSTSSVASAPTITCNE